MAVCEGEGRRRGNSVQEERRVGEYERIKPFRGGSLEESITEMDKGRR